MDRRRWLVAGGLGVLALGALAAVVLEVPVAALLSAVLGGGSGGAGGIDFAPAGDGPGDFEAAVENVTTCGPTCRTLKATLRYTGADPVERVRLDMRVLANGTRLWQGTRSVGTMGPGDTYAIDQDADVGFAGARAALETDGRVTARIHVRHADGSETLEAVLTVS